jgi:iron complex transport system substrate-binding protein
MEVEIMIKKICINKISIIVGILVLLIVSCLMAGCGGEKASDKEVPKEITVKDSLGREVSVPSKIERVVDLAIMDGTRVMVLLGVEDKLVGASDRVTDIMFGEDEDWYAVPKVAPQLKDLPCVGTPSEPNAEYIMSLKPDVILAYTTFGDSADSLTEQTGIPVVCIGADSCLNFEMYKLVGKIVGKEDRAEELSSYAEGKIEEITKVTSKISEAERVKVFYWSWNWPKSGEANTTDPYDPIDMAGGINVAKEATTKPYDYFSVTKEQLAVWNPDVIVMEGGESEAKEELLADPALQTINAIKNKRIYFAVAMDYGYDQPLGVCEVQYLAKLFYPDKFTDLNVEKECNEIMKKFYGVDGLWSDMLDKRSNVYRWE